MTTLGIFAKPPVPGLVKTRLIPDIGAQRAARVYRYCLEYTLDLARASGLDYELYLSADSDDALFRHQPYSLQQGADLGQRMGNALRRMLADRADNALLIGSDCLDLKIRHLHAAAQALGDHELVLLPAADGGYALIGCRAADAALFRGVGWGGDQVLEQTLANARGLGYRVSLLETLRDIDRLQDVEAYPELLALIAAS